MSKKHPLPLRDVANFYSLLKAAINGDVALVAAVRKRDQKQVTLICATQTIEGGDFVIDA